MVGALSGCSLLVTNTELALKTPGASLYIEVPKFTINGEYNPMKTVKWVVESVKGLIGGTALPEIPGATITQVSTHRNQLVNVMVNKSLLPLRVRAVIVLGAWAMDKSREAHRYKSTLRVRAVIKV